MTILNHQNDMLKYKFQTVKITFLTFQLDQKVLWFHNKSGL